MYSGRLAGLNGRLCQLLTLRQSLLLIGVYGGILDSGVIKYLIFDEVRSSETVSALGLSLSLVEVDLPLVFCRCGRPA